MNPLQETILIVDNNPETLKLLRDILQPRNYEVHMAMNGIGALAYAQAEKPDLILLAARLPDMSGYDVCGRLKSGEATRQIPVIFIPDPTEPLDRTRLFSMGGTDYITRPFEAGEVLQRVKNLLTIYPLQREPVGESRTLEQKVIERTRELSRAHRSRKREALSMFARGMAHDFNNILSMIFGYNNLAMVHLDKPDRLRKDIQGIQNGALRAKELVKQILGFSRVTEQDHEPVQMDLILSETLKRLRPTVPPSIEIRESVDTRLRVPADADQLREVIINLCTNACHAMGDKGGTLSISLKERKLTDDEMDPGLDIAAGNFLVLEVRDTGRGMDEETLDRIFDPYFTTREKGEGKGLGLSLVQGIVRNSKGFITVDSEKGRGTAFHVYLPVFEGKTVEPERKTSEQNAPGGGERIMFVDDEEQIVKIAQLALSRYGYEPTTFNDPVQAFQEFERQPERYDLVISDMTMPRMNGIELLKRVLKLRPGMPVMLCSGYTDPGSRKEIDGMALHFYQKPIVISEFVGMVREVLDKS